MNKNELRNTILSQIQLPCIGKNWMQVEPVSGQMQTRQLQQAIDDLSWRGGGTLVLQPGVYRTGALHLKNGVELHLASEMGNVLSRALRIIICISVIFWLLSYSADGNVANSIIYKVGTFIEPVTSLFGLPWQLFIAFVASAMGKEASLGVMASLFNTGSIWAAIEQSATVDTAALSTSMLSVISRPEALAFLFAFFFNMPCLMALTATTQETHSMKWTVRIALYYVLTALIMATIAYHVGLVIF